MSLTKELRSQIKEELELISRKDFPFTIGSIKSIGMDKVIDFITYRVSYGLNNGVTISQAIKDYENDLSGGELWVLSMEVTHDLLI